MDLDMLKRLAQIACDEAISNGADCADVSVGSGRSLAVHLESSAIKSCDSKSGGGISVRAIKSGGTGWFSADSLTPEAAAEAGRGAAKLALIATPDPDFVALPSPAAEYPEIEGLSDPALAEIDIAQLIRWALKNVDEALAVHSDGIVDGGFSVNYHAGALVNSNGISLARESSYIGGHNGVVIRHGDDVGSSFEYDSARMLADFSPEGIGARAAEKAAKFLGARKVKTGRMPIVLGPLASDSIFASVVHNCDAENIQRGRSFMIGKLGQKIGSDVLTITDDPLIPRGLSSRAYDPEGFPCKPLVVMEKGVLKSYLYGSYTAGRAKVANTGHGVRGGGSSTSNINPKLGTMTAAEIIESTPEGIYIDMGGINPNGVTGDVSCVIDFGFKIEHGELTYPVMSAMVGGSFLELLSNVDAISSDYRSEPGQILPTLRIQDVLVAGGG